MKRKGSRYENTRPFSAEKGFSGFRERKLTTPPGIVEHTVLHTDRLDHLADSYYKNDRRWWRVMDANSAFLYGFELFNDKYQLLQDTPEAPEDALHHKHDVLGDVIIIPASIPSAVENDK